MLDLTELAPTFDVAFGGLSTACSRRLVTPAQLRAAVGRRAKMRWRAEIRAALSDISDGVHSSLENLYPRNVERPHRLPKVLRQARMQRGSGSAYLDNLFGEFAVAVELDGRASHPVEARWQDIHRDNYFARTGVITLRYNWADVSERPCEVAREIALVLRHRGWTGTLRACRPGCAARLQGVAAGGASWTSQSTASGGTVSTADAGLPCHGSATASTAPMLPTPLPP